MPNKLYKVNVEVAVFVVAESQSEAAKIAKQNAGGEVADFGLAHASEVKSKYDIPDDWKKVMPYSEGAMEKRTCFAFMEAQKDVNNIESQPTVKIEKPKEETKEEIKEDLPIELPQNNNNDLPQLRFKI